MSQEIHYELTLEHIDPMGTDITVIVTCHDYGQYLAQCLASVIGQSHRAARIILVNDASTDDTEEIALSFPTVEYLRVDFHDVCRTRNVLLSSVTTKWVLFVDADNWLQQRYLEAMQKTALSCDSAVAIIYPSKRIFGRQDEIITAPVYDAARLDTENYMDACSLIRTDALRGLHGWTEPMCDARGYSHDDWGLWLKLRGFDWVAEPCPDALLMYRVHATNESRYGKVQATNTLLRHATFTILTVLSGRRWNFARTLDWLERMDCVPDQVVVYFLDNSDDPKFTREILNRLATQERFMNHHYERVLTHADPSGQMTNAEYGEGGIAERLERDAYIHRHVASLYRQAFSRITTDFVLCVEDDVIPQDTVLTELVGTLAGRKAIGAVGATVMSRIHVGEVIAGANPVVLDGSVQTVDFVSAGCTLYRTRALKATRPRYEMTDQGPLFWDVSICEDMKKAGWSTLLDTAVKTKHYQSNGNFV